MLKPNNEFISTGVLVAILIPLLMLTVIKAQALAIDMPTNIMFDKASNTLNYSTLTLRQKIGQMVITFGAEWRVADVQKMAIGGIFLSSKISKEYYISTITNFQRNSSIPLFVTADLEGCLNPFEKFQYFPTLRQITTVDEAYRVGSQAGALLKELGFNMDFAPVIDLNDTIWNCRNFEGTPQEIADKAEAYIKGMQENGIIATSKHYPGKALVVKDPHAYLTYVTITDDDLLPFEQTMGDVSSVMVSHVIASGAVQSESKPSVVSQSLVHDLRTKFTGLIVTDEIRMLGLRNYYENIDDMYVDLLKADNDIILNFDTNPQELYRMITVMENAVKSGQVDERRIDNSVLRILTAKGIKIVF